MPAGVKYYCDVLGFHINYAQHDLGVMDRDDVTVLLIAKTEEHTGIGSCYIYVNDADCASRRTGFAGSERSGRAGKPSVGPS